MHNFNYLIFLEVEVVTTEKEVETLNQQFIQTSQDATQLIKNMIDYQIIVSEKTNKKI